MECELGINVDLGGIFEAPTIMRLMERINSYSTFDRSVVVPLQDNGDGIPVFCLLGINLYQALADGLGEKQSVYGVYVPEEESLFEEISVGNNPELSIDRFSEAYCDAIQAWQPKGPYRLAGFSFGGILAVETASKLQQRGEDVDLVFLFDSPLAKSVKQSWLQKIRNKVSDLQYQNFSNLFEALIRKARIAGKADEQLHLTDLDSRDRIAALQRYFQRKILKDYRGPRVGLNGQFVLIRTPSTTHERSLEDLFDYGWGRFLGSKLRVHQVLGNHETMLSRPNVQAVADTMVGYLS
jgi:thioesterase domain-containing protein